MQENYPNLTTTKPLKAEFKKFQKIYITSDQFTIGRSLENSIVIAYLAISRKHCMLKKINDGTWGIQDFSSFGILVNNKKLEKGVLHTLSNDDVIQFDLAGEFVYKYILPNEDVIPRKRIKLEKHSDSMTETHDILQNVKLKFEESQSFELNHIEEKIESNKQIQNTSIMLKNQLELEMSRKLEKLQNNFALQIENLIGEKSEVERQKAALEHERDLQLSNVKKEMEDKIKDLMEQVKKHNETESELLKENANLKEKLLKERDEFLTELDRENTSKQDLLQQLEAKMKEQEEVRLKEKKELENMLRAETEQLRQAKEKELKELEEQKKMAEQELNRQLDKMKSDLEEKVQQTEAERIRLEKELKAKSEEMKALSDEEKSRIEHIEHIKVRETELAAVAAEKIQKEAEQSNLAISRLQEQLEKVKSQLVTVEAEKNTLLINQGTNPGEGSSKQVALTEVGELMESELQCSICAELFVGATTLNCSHTFCKYCITVWRKKKNECPICRAFITSDCRSLVLDSFIEKMVSNLTEEMKAKREAMLKDRWEEAKAAMRPTPAARNTTRNNSRRNRRTTATTTTRRTTTSTSSTSSMNTRSTIATVVDLTRISDGSVSTVRSPVVMRPQPVRIVPGMQAPLLPQHQGVQVPVVEVEDGNVSQVSRARTTGGTGAVTGAARAVTGLPVARAEEVTTSETIEL